MRVSYSLFTASKLHSISVVPAPEVVIQEHPIPYNGRVFTLNGVAQLDRSVDTNVTVTGVWSDSDGVQVATSQEYTTSLEFQPLASGNSKQYILNVTIAPTDNSSFVIASSTSIGYNLIVQRKII